jgi:hypothetical protein
MNTVLSDDELRTVSGDLSNYERVIAIQQDAHTKSLIADEVRALIKEELECFQDEGYNEALQAVLKLIEAKE